ncbi:MAG: hypothetical protein LBT62_02740 [Deltaproteobacteria bacterium]|nr:hypothetical protein [Deltaproteobacteria bacterium]
MTPTLSSSTIVRLMFSSSAIVTSMFLSLEIVTTMLGAPSETTAHGLFPD